MVAALETGRSSWTALLGVQRPGPADDATAVTAAQVRDVIEGPRAAGQHHDGDPDIMVVFDAGYEVCWLAFLLADLPSEVLGRLRSDRVLHSPTPTPAPAPSSTPASTSRAPGRPPRHGAAFALARALDAPQPTVTTTTDTTRYGTATATA